MLLNAAEQRIDAGTAAMLVNIGPVFVAVLAGLLLHEGFPRTLVAGCAVAFAGTVVIGLATSERGVDAGWGAALCVAAAAAYAGGVIAQKPLLERTSALQVTFLACLVGAVACLPFAPALVRELGDREHGVGRLDRLPRHLPDGGRLHDVGLRAQAHERRQGGRDDVPRAADRRAAGLGDPRRDAAGARAARRRALPRRRGHHPTAIIIGVVTRARSPGSSRPPCTISVTESPAASPCPAANARSVAEAVVEVEPDVAVDAARRGRR